MSLQEVETPRTAYGCLEESHWAVAKAAMELAEAVEFVLTLLDEDRRVSGQTRVSDSFTDPLRGVLVRFREAAARPI